MRIFEARARGWSITLRDIVPDYALERQSLKGTANFLINRRMNRTRRQSPAASSLRRL
jgi:hypothetical protein